jgi:hypothetical protein
MTKIKHPALTSALLIVTSLASLLIPAVTVVVTSPMTILHPVTVSQTSSAIIRLTTDVTDVSLSRIGDMYVMHVMSMKTVISMTSSYAVPYVATFTLTSTSITHKLVPLSALIGNLVTILVLTTVGIAAAGVFIIGRRSRPTAVVRGPQTPVRPFQISDARYVELLERLEQMKTGGKITEEIYLKLKDEYQKRLERE